MFDKKNAAKVKTVVDYALSPEGQNCWRWGIFRWTNKVGFINERLPH
jgi:ABC-type Fe3+ transport system substrate-binding protein